MATQNGIIQLQGTIGNITFYKTQAGYLAREKGGVSASVGQLLVGILLFPGYSIQL